MQNYFKVTKTATNMFTAKLDTLKTKKDVLFRRYIFNEMKNSARSRKKIFTQVGNSFNVEVEKRT